MTDLAGRSAVPSTTARTMLPDPANHAALVDTWMERVATGLSPAELLRLFKRALQAVAQRSQQTLGEVTLAAILDRVLHTASERYSFLSTLEAEAPEFRFDGLDKLEVAAGDGRVREAFRFVLAELLTVLGNLTAEILTPVLHAELGKIKESGS